MSVDMQELKDEIQGLEDELLLAKKKVEALEKELKVANEKLSQVESRARISDQQLLEDDSNLLSFIQVYERLSFSHSVDYVCIPKIRYFQLGCVLYIVQIRGA